MVTTRMSIMVMRRECFLSILWWLRQRLKYIHKNIHNINTGLVSRLDYLSLLRLFGISRALRFSARISPQNSKALKTTNDMHGNRWMKKTLILKFCSKRLWAEIKSCIPEKYIEIHIHSEVFHPDCEIHNTDVFIFMWTCLD